MIPCYNGAEGGITGESNFLAVRLIEKGYVVKDINPALAYDQRKSAPTFQKNEAEIGDIRRFPNADKLARYAGIAPIKFSSVGKDKEESSRQGNRQLQGLFYFLTVSMVTVPKSGKPNQPVFYAYFQRKISEGKTK